MGGLTGLGMQVRANIIQLVYLIVRNTLVIIPLHFLKDLKFFFFWITVCSCIYLLALRIVLIQSLGLSIRKFFSMGKISRSEIYKLRAFSVGMFLITVVFSVNTQVDKIVIGNLFSLEILGHYNLAFAMAVALHSISSPLSIVFLPKMTKLYTAGNLKEAVKIYKSHQLGLSIVLCSPMALMIIFPKEVMLLWTRNIDLATKSAKFLPLLALATASNALNTLVYNVAIANGNTKLNNIIGISTMILSVPGYIILGKSHGVIGVAFWFSFMQTVSVFIFMIIVNNQYIQLKTYKFLCLYFLIPMFVSCITCLWFSSLDYGFGSNLSTILFFIVVCLTSVLINTLLFKFLTGTKISDYIL